MCFLAMKAFSKYLPKQRIVLNLNTWTFESVSRILIRKLRNIFLFTNSHTLNYKTRSSLNKLNFRSE